MSNAERVAMFMQVLRYAPSTQVNSSVDIVNTSISERDKWPEIDQAGPVSVYPQRPGAGSHDRPAQHRQR